MNRGRKQKPRTASARKAYDSKGSIGKEVQRMLAKQVVFPLDVDNTLLDNDGVLEDLMLHLEREAGRATLTGPTLKSGEPGRTTSARRPRPFRYPALKDHEAPGR